MHCGSWRIFNPIFIFIRHLFYESRMNIYFLIEITYWVNHKAYTIIENNFYTKYETVKKRSYMGLDPRIIISVNRRDINNLTMIQWCLQFAIKLFLVFILIELHDWLLIIKLTKKAIQHWIEWNIPFYRCNSWSIDEYKKCGVRMF